MDGLETFDRILASLHEVALDHADWSNASALMDEALGTKGNCLIFGEGACQDDIELFFAKACFRGQHHRELEQLYFEAYYLLDERVPRLTQLPDSQLVHVSSLYTDEEIKASRGYNEMLPLFSARNSLNVRLDGPAGSHIVWVAGDPASGDDWSSAQLHLIRRLLPHIRQAFCVRQALANAGSLGEALKKLLDATGVGIVHLDVRGRIVAANDRVRDALRTGDGLFDNGGFLYARRRDDDACLQTLLKRALPAFGARGAGGSMMVRRSEALLPLALHVNPVSGQDTGFPGSPVAALVLVVDPVHELGIDPAVVAAALDLTGMESRVAVLLAQGMSVREVAAATERKESTIRSHVKHMFTKHGLSRQTELVRLVLSLAGSPDTRR